MKVICNSSNKPYISSNKALILPTGADINVRHYEFTIDENTVYPLEAASDSVIASHYSDTSARIVIVPKSNITEGSSGYSVTMAIGNNVSADGKYQALIRTNHTTIYGVAPISSQVQSNSFLQAKDDGKIIIFPYGTSSYFAAGTYDLYFMW